MTMKRLAAALLAMLVASPLCAATKIDYKGIELGKVKATQKTLAKGVTLVSLESSIPCKIHYVKFNLKENPKLRMRFAYGPRDGRPRSTPEEMAKFTAKDNKETALAAINGDFFLYEKVTKTGAARPFGVTVVDGKLIERGCWDPRGYDVIARLKDGSYAIGKLTSSTSTNGAFVAYCDGKEVTDAIRVWNRPLVGGEIKSGKELNCYPEDNQKNYPRTLIGLGKDLIVFFVADARWLMNSHGISSAQASEIMKREGCTEVGQFDGGGSTSLWAKGKYANHPSDGKPRAVSNGLVVTAAK